VGTRPSRASARRSLDLTFCIVRVVIRRESRRITSATLQQPRGLALAAPRSAH
jgi:hypothetical protein